jgi:hypothetical protein
MTKGKKILIFLCASAQVMLLGDSLFLVNDADFTLTAVIEDAGGNVLEETDIDSQDSINWSKDYEYFGYHSNTQNPHIPYKVTWYCPNGEVYGVCRDITTDTTVRARSCLGARRCRQPNP